jgi:Tol biopolymer transport system component
MEISPDGSGGQALACATTFSDLSHDAVSGDRWFIYSTTIPGEVDPKGYAREELFLFPYSERFDSGCAHRQVSSFATNHTSVHPMIPRWSPDGTKVAFVAWSSEEDAPGAVVGTYDVWIADVVPGASSVTLANFRDLSPEVITGTVWPLSWSDDSEWITYSRRNWPGTIYSVYVVDVDSGAEFNVSPDGSRNEFQPAFAPDDNGSTYRIGFMRSEPAVTPTNYLWVGSLTATSGAPNGPLTGVTQLTSKKSGNIVNAGYPAWEPDGNHLVFSGTDNGYSGRYDLYRIGADGKGKARSITDFLSDGTGAAAIWRTSE